MPIAINCSNPECNFKRRVADHLAGRVVKCPNCKSEIRIGGTGGTQSDWIEIVPEGTSRDESTPKWIWGLVGLVPLVLIGLVFFAMMDDDAKSDAVSVAGADVEAKSAVPSEASPPERTNEVPITQQTHTQPTNEEPPEATVKEPEQSESEQDKPPIVTEPEPEPPIPEKTNTPPILAQEPVPPPTKPVQIKARPVKAPLISPPGEVKILSDRLYCPTNNLNIAVNHTDIAAGSGFDWLSVEFTYEKESTLVPEDYLVQTSTGKESPVFAVAFGNNQTVAWRTDAFVAENVLLVPTRSKSSTLNVKNSKFNEYKSKVKSVTLIFRVAEKESYFLLHGSDRFEVTPGENGPATATSTPSDTGKGRLKPLGYYFSKTLKGGVGTSGGTISPKISDEIFFVVRAEAPTEYFRPTDEEFKQIQSRDNGTLRITSRDQVQICRPNQFVLSFPNDMVMDGELLSLQTSGFSPGEFTSMSSKPNNDEKVTVEIAWTLKQSIVKHPLKIKIADSEFVSIPEKELK